jgi:ubiquinone biosynthesis accessory factor UbiJ
LNLLAPLALKVLHHLLGQNPGAQEGLSRHAGKTLRIEGGLFSLDIAVTNDGAFMEAALASPDATIKLDPGSLLSLPIAGKAAFKSLQTTGDADLLAEVNHIFQTLQWDVEADLAPLVGNIAAHRLSSGAESLGDWARQSRESIAATLAEYLTEEQPVLANRSQVEHFYHEVDVLRDDAARLEARLIRLESAS